MRRTLPILITIAATAALTATVTSQWDTDNPAAAQAMQKMAKWMELGQPGPEHEKLASMAGDWKHHNTYRMYPGADPQVSEADANAEVLYSGRYLVERYSGAFEMGDQKMPFEGMTILGYDRVAEEHFFVWLDSMSTGIMVMRGKENADGTITYHGETTNPLTKKPMKMKSVHRTMPDGSIGMDWYEWLGDANGEWFHHAGVIAKRP